MEAEKKHNGFANYETWAVCLWLENNEGNQAYWVGAAREAREEAADCWQVREGIWEPRRAPVYLLATRLKEELNEGMPELGPNLYSDLLNAALSEVDWHEVAETFIDEEFDSQPF
ncbi:hypothetical protein TA3x_005796 (plasmid) [Tundrisphaera sp. TA3]|uniref:hypothetical protein n=1 Tax=Tundrisphaera sp. TA3 TaxID=3435775 RepID=UPI003EBF2A48